MGKILKYWPKEEIIKALQDLPKNKPINKKSLYQYYKKGLICETSLIPRKFGSIKNACKKAGVRCDALYGKEHIQHIAKLNTKYTKEKLLQLIKKHHKKYKNFTPTHFILCFNKDTGSDIRGAINRHFGTYKNLLKEAGIEYRNYYWTNNRILETLEDLNNLYGPLMKIDIQKFIREKKICGAKLIRDRFGSLDNAAKLAGFEFLEPKDILHDFNGKIGKKETEELDKIEKIYNIKLFRQYRVETDYGVYFIDGYDKKNNIAYEIDENHHKYDSQICVDNIREKHIIKNLKCNFVRIKLFNK